MSLELEEINLGCPASQELAEEEPGFATHKPSIDEIKEAAENHARENLVLVGNGGSVTSFRAYYRALEEDSDVKVEIVTSMSPKYLSKIADRFPPEETVVMPVSKSGETTGVIESLLFFMEKDYPVFGVTSDNDGALRKILEKKELPFIEHPDISGRFTGTTETALVPACFAGLDIEKIREGAEDMYEEFSPGPEKNMAKNAAIALYNSEISGFDEVFTPFYSERLIGFYPLLVQLFHETLCKDERGQTVFGDEGPECQHHTVQRLFGGRKNILTFFFREGDKSPKTLKVDPELYSINIRGSSLEEFDGNLLSDSLNAEMEGVLKAVEEKNLPAMVLSVEKVSPRTCGELIAFLQYMAFYSAKLRDVEPFNQPDVERSKELGFRARFDG